MEAAAKRPNKDNSKAVKTPAANEENDMVKDYFIIRIAADMPKH